jgi:hypothetical protein
MRTLWLTVLGRERLVQAEVVNPSTIQVRGPYSFLGGFLNLVAIELVEHFRVWLAS